jgi:hypothetical protein
LKSENKDVVGIEVNAIRHKMQLCCQLDGKDRIGNRQRSIPKQLNSIVSSPVTAVKARGVALTKNAQNVQPIKLEVNWDALRLPYDRLHVWPSW